jgi:plastocyanin
MVLVGVAAFALLSAAQAFADDTTPLPGAANVRIDNFTFNPPVLTVPAGTTVTWQNVDDIPHTVVAPEAKMRSKPLDTNDSFSFTFTNPGEFGYFCSLHPHMMGKVIVTR